MYNSHSSVIINHSQGKIYVIYYFFFSSIFVLSIYIYSIICLFLSYHININIKLFEKYGECPQVNRIL